MSKKTIDPVFYFEDDEFVVGELRFDERGADELFRVLRDWLKLQRPKRVERLLEREDQEREESYEKGYYQLFN
jgi:hypothetical protein